jgi:hypothetical protein
MRRSALWSVVVATLISLVASAVPAAANLLIVVDKNAQRMSVWVDGTPRYTWKVSTGRPGYDTPNGAYRPFRLERDYFSKEWDDAPMPHAIFFTQVGHAIHGSYDTKHLGTPVSHGCIRISPDNAALLFSLVEAEGLEKTKVVVSGGTPALVAKRFDAPAQPKPFAPAMPEWTARQQPPRYWGPPSYDDGSYTDGGVWGDGW